MSGKVRPVLWSVLIMTLLSVAKSQSKELAGCMNSLDWTTGLDYWTGLLDSLKNVVLHHFESR